MSSIGFEKWYSFISKIIDTREKLIIELLYYSGCSESELISIRCSDFDLQKDTIKFSNRSSRIPKHLSLRIKQFIKISKREFLFYSRQSQQISPKRVQQIISSLSLKHMGEKLTPQDIRVIHIYHALLKNISFISISHQTGLSYQRIAQVAEQYKGKLSKNSFGYEL